MHSFLNKKEQSNLKSSGKKYLSTKNIRQQKGFVGGKFRREKIFVDKKFRHFLPTKFLPIRYYKDSDLKINSVPCFRW